MGAGVLISEQLKARYRLVTQTPVLTSELKNKQGMGVLR
jgi:hypothetical protein